MYSMKPVQLIKTLVPLGRQAMAVRMASGGVSGHSKGGQKMAPSQSEVKPGQRPDIPLEYEEVPLAEGIAITVKSPEGGKKKKEKSGYLNRDKEISKTDEMLYKGHEASQKMYEKARDLKEKTGEKMDQFMDKVAGDESKLGHMAETVKENVAGMKDTIKQKVKKAGKKLKGEE